jgi:hypothetical protein
MVSAENLPNPIIMVYSPPQYLKSIRLHKAGSSWPRKASVLERPPSSAAAEKPGPLIDGTVRGGKPSAREGFPPRTPPFQRRDRRGRESGDSIVEIMLPWVFPSSARDGTRPTLTIKIV